MAAISDYISANAGIFKHAGQPIKYGNLDIVRLQTTLPITNLDAINDVFEAATTSVDGRRIYTKMITEAMLQAQRDTLANIERHFRVADARMMDKTNVLVPLKVDDADIEKVMFAIINDMYGNESVKANVFSIGSVTAGAGNVGTGSMLCDKKLDGVSQPCQRLKANRRYLNVDSEMACVETIRAICVADSHGQLLSPYVKKNQIVNGRLVEPSFVEGNELWYIYGQNPSTNRITSLPGYGTGIGFDAEGSGAGPLFYGSDYNNSTIEQVLLSNNAFEIWSTTNVPDGWSDNDAGAHTTNVLRSTTHYTGTYSMQFLGDAATTDIRRAQNISPVALQNLVGNKRYYFGFWMRGETGATGTISVLFTGTNYTAAASEKVTMAAPTSATWVHYGFPFTLPSTVPSDLQIKFEYTGTPAAKSLWFDAPRFQPVQWHGGLNFVIYNGDVPPAIGDTFDVAITQSATGIIQQHEKRWHGVQLPSNAAGGETVPDTLV